LAAFHRLPWPGLFPAFLLLVYNVFVDREIQQSVQNLFALERKVEELRSSCKWGRDEIEDVEFFRRYITNGNTAFLSQYNGYRRLKPFVYTLYQNPNSPSLLDSKCLKGFAFSSLKIAWSEYLSKSKGDKKFSGPVGESYDFSRFYESLSGKDVEEIVKGLYEKSSKDPKLRNIGQALEALSITLLFREVFSKYIREFVLSKDQSEAVDKIVEALNKKSEELKDGLFSEIDKRKGEVLPEDFDFGDIKKSKDFEKAVAREYFTRNRGRVDRAKVESLVAEIKRSVGGQDRKSVEDVLDSAKQFFTSPGQVKFGDLPKVLGGAEAISLARKIFGYTKRLEEIAEEIEKENKNIQKALSSSSNQDSKMPNRINGNKNGGNGNGNGGKGGSSNNRGKEGSFSLNPNDKRRLEEFFKGVIQELSILYELLDFLTKKHRGFEKFKRDFGKVFKRISDAIRSIAERMGLSRLLTPEGIIALLSELALQLT
jgi:hypothetical protein